LAGGGLALGVTGAVLAGLGARELDRLKQTMCGVAHTCEPSSYSDWETRQNAGWGLIAVGGATLAAGVIWGTLTTKSRRAEKSARTFTATGVRF
jgi:hypothetical protein